MFVTTERQLNAALPDLCELLRKGNYLKVACRALGIDFAEVYRRIRVSKTDDGRKSDRDFAEQIERALAKGELDLVEAVRTGLYPTREGGGSDWRASLAVLERRHPLTWSTNREGVARSCAHQPVKPSTVTILAPLSVEQEIEELKAENAALRAKLEGASSA